MSRTDLSADGLQRDDIVGEASGGLDCFINHDRVGCRPDLGDAAPTRSADELSCHGLVTQFGPPHSLSGEQSTQYFVVLRRLGILGVEADLQLYFAVDTDQLRFVVLARVIVEPHLQAAAVHVDVSPATDPGDEALERIAHDLEKPRLHRASLRSCGWPAIEIC
jgi:hypothetical protein